MALVRTFGSTRSLASLSVSNVASMLFAGSVVCMRANCSKFAYEYRTLFVRNVHSLMTIGTIFDDVTFCLTIQGDFLFRATQLSACFTYLIQEGSATKNLETSDQEFGNQRPRMWKPATKNPETNDQESGNQRPRIWKPATKNLKTSVQESGYQRLREKVIRVE